MNPKILRVAEWLNDNGFEDEARTASFLESNYILKFASSFKEELKTLKESDTVRKIIKQFAWDDETQSLRMHENKIHDLTFYYKLILENIVPEDLEDPQKGVLLRWLRTLGRHDSEFGKTMVNAAEGAAEEIEFNPTSSEAEIAYVAKQFMNYEELSPIFEQFFHWNQFMSDKDLGNIKSLEQLISIVEEADSRIIEHQNKVKYDDEDEGSDIVVDDDEWRIATVHSRGAAKFWGRGTRWCTATNTECDYFAKYYGGKDKPLIVFVDKKTGKKFQMSTIEDVDIMDASDEPVDERTRSRILNTIVTTDLGSKVPITNIIYKLELYDSSIEADDWFEESEIEEIGKHFPTGFLRVGLLTEDYKHYFEDSALEMAINVPVTFFKEKINTFFPEAASIAVESMAAKYPNVFFERSFHKYYPEFSELAISTWRESRKNSRSEIFTSPSPFANSDNRREFRDLLTPAVNDIADWAPKLYWQLNLDEDFPEDIYNALRSTLVKDPAYLIEVGAHTKYEDQLVVTIQHGFDYPWLVGGEVQFEKKYFYNFAKYFPDLGRDRVLKWATKTYINAKMFEKFLSEAYPEHADEVSEYISQRKEIPGGHIPEEVVVNMLSNLLPMGTTEPKTAEEHEERRIVNELTPGALNQITGE